MADNVESLGKVRADKTGKAKDWTTKDALERALELINSGEIEADCCIIAIASKPYNDDTQDYHFLSSVPNNLMAAGLGMRAVNYYSES